MEVLKYIVEDSTIAELLGVQNFSTDEAGSRFKSEDSIKRKYVYKYKNPEIGYQLYRKYVDGKIKNKEEFLKNLKEME